MLFEKLLKKFILIKIFKIMKTKLKYIYCTSAYLHDGQEIHFAVSSRSKLAEINADLNRIIKNVGGKKMSAVIEVPGEVYLEKDEKILMADGNFYIVKDGPIYTYKKTLMNPCNYPFNINK